MTALFSSFSVDWLLLLLLGLTLSLKPSPSQYFRASDNSGHFPSDPQRIKRHKSPWKEASVTTGKGQGLSLGCGECEDPQVTWKGAQPVSVGGKNLWIRVNYFANTIVWCVLHRIFHLTLTAIQWSGSDYFCLVDRKLRLRGLPEALTEPGVPGPSPLREATPVCTRSQVTSPFQEPGSSGYQETEVSQKVSHIFLPNQYSP